MDRLTSMSVFVKAVELGSFAAAAEALMMSPQLVGKHVSVLEKHLGVRLLNRTTRRHSLTETGKHFYERTKIILAEVEAAESCAAKTRSRPHGHLIINAPVSFGVHTLSPLLKLYMKQFPDISVELRLTNRIVDLIDEGYDAVFRIGDLSDSGLKARKLAPYRLIACASPAYLSSNEPLNTPIDLLQHECLVFSHTSRRTHWFFNAAKDIISVPVSGRLLINNDEALLSSAIAGLGITIQPIELVRTALEAGSLVTVLTDYTVPSLPLHILYAPDRVITPKLRSFLDFVTNHLL